MKHTCTRSVNRLFFLPVLIAFLGLFSGRAFATGTTLARGEIAIIGFSGITGGTHITFVTWVDLLPGTVINFTTNPFLSTASANASNNAAGSTSITRWTNTEGASIPAGTVISLYRGAGESGTDVCTRGSQTFVANSDNVGAGAATSTLISLTTSGRAVFAYQGSDYSSNTASPTTPTTFNGTILFGFTYQGTGAVPQGSNFWLTTGTTVNNFKSFLPSELAASSSYSIDGLGVKAVDGQYTGPRTGASSMIAYQALVTDPLNWTVTSVNGTPSAVNYTSFAGPAPSITATITATNVTCNGGSDGTATITAVSGGTTPYTYSWAPSGGSAATATGLSAATYTCTITDATSVSITKTVTVTQPAAITISGTATVCPAGTTTLTPSVSGGTWSSSSTSTATIGASNGVVTGVVAGATSSTVTMSYTPSGGCPAVTKVVTVNAGPSAITGNGSFGLCNLANIQFTNTVSGGIWSSSNTAVATVNPTTGMVRTLSASTSLSAGTVTISYTLSGCTRIVTTNISNNGATPTGVGITCIGGHWNIVDAYVGGTWMSATPTVGTIDSVGYFTAIAAGMETVQYSCGTNAVGIASRTFSVVPTPAAIQGTFTLCPSSTTTLTDSASWLGSYLWTSSNSTVATVGSASGIVTGVAAGTARISFANSCGTVVQVVTVNGIPSVSGITGTTSVNVGSTTTLSSATTGGVWASSNTAVGTVGSNSGVVTGLTAGTTKISYTVTNGCFSRTVTVDATVLAGFSATLSQTNVTCNGGSDGTATVTVNGGTTPYTYSWAPSGGSGPMATGLTAGTYTCTVTDATSASFDSVFTITEPPVLALSGTATLCTTTTLNATVGGGAWSSGNTSVATVNSSGVVTAIAAGTSEITYINTCGTVTQIVTVDVADPGSITGAATVCVAATIGHNSTGASGGVWASSNTAVGTIDPTTGLLAGIANGTTTVSYTVTNGCGSMSATMVNTVYALSDPGTITGPSSVCAGSTITVTSSSTTTASPYSNTWSSSATAIATVNPTTGVVAGLSGGTTRISYTATGCGTFNSFYTVNVLPIPTVSVISGTTTVAMGSVTALSNTTSGGAWSSTNTAAGTVDGSGNVTGINLGTTTISYLVSNSCGNAVATVDVTVVSSLSFTQSQTNVTCFGGNDGTATVVPSGGITPLTYSWAPSGGSAATATGLSAGTYTCTITDASSYSVAATFTITQPSAFTISSVSNNGPVCSGTTLSLATSSSGGATPISYSWSGPNSFSSTTQNPSITGATTAATGIYSVTLTDGNGCIATGANTTSATVNPAISISSINNDGPVCEGSMLNLTSATSGGMGAVSYSWSGPGSFSSTAQNPSVTTTTANNGVYTLTVTDANLCTATATTTAAVNALPTVASITPSTTTICNGTPLTFTAGTTTGTGTLTSYNWSGPNGYSTTTATGSAVFTPTTTASSGVYTLTVTYPNTGCTSNPVTSSSVTVNDLPTITSISASPSSLCVGFPITLTGSGASGTGSLISYNWSGPSSYSSTTATGTQTYTAPAASASGSYSVSVTYTGTGCTSATVASAPVTVIPLPTAYTVTGGGAYCAGGIGQHIVLNFSNVGVNYQLYNGSTAVGSPMPGSNSALDFGLQTTAGTYSAVATNVSTGCMSNMTGSATISINALPAVYGVSGGGSYCVGGSGVTVGMANSATGINYQLYNGSTAIGSATAGTGAAFSFGSFTAAGTYTVLATDATSACTSDMSGSATISINALPSAYTVTGGGNFCATGTGVHVGLSNSDAGVNYQLYNGTSAVGSPIAGASSGLDFGFQTTAGVYSVRATTVASGCQNGMSGTATVVVNPLPTAFSVTGGGTICSGAAGASVGLGNSNTGITYQLYNGASTVGSAVNGTNAAITFGAQTAAGTYTVLATNATTGCTNPMSSSATVIVNSLPAAFTVTGGGSYCAGGAGQAIGLSNSATGINYQLYNGSTSIGSAVAGTTGSAISFGAQTASGTYTVMATNTSTSCTNAMTGSATISINPLPTAYTISGGGAYCSGGTGVHIGLNNSTTGVNYQLYEGASTSGSFVAGTGSAIDFGLRTNASTLYSVVATNATTGCVNNMTGTATVSINSLPGTQTVSGGGSFCAGGAGVDVSLNGSVSGVNYQLYNGATTVGSAVAGTGASIDYGNQTTAGTYSVQAIDAVTGCTNAMSGTAVVVVNPLPTGYSVTGGGNYCQGGSGFAVGLASSNTGIDYQLYNGSTAVGSAVSGNNAAISFGVQTAAGTYTVRATNTTTSCVNGMTGSVAIVINPLPTVVNVTGGGAYCTGSAAPHIGLDFSSSGVNYQLYNGSTAVGSPLAGAASSLDFGVQSVSGTYTVSATNATTGCTQDMAGSATVIINPLPVQYSVTGGGNYCAGGSGRLVGLSNSETSVNYQLYNGTTATGSAVAGTTGSAISFGSQTAAGTYTVRATNSSTGCVNNMTSSAAVTIDPLPVAQTVTGGGTYCAGGTGFGIGLNGSQTTVNYQLYNGSSTVGSPVTGTGSAFSFGVFTAAGTYSVRATNSTTGCVNDMTGTAVIVMNPLPTVFNMGGGGSYCTGGAGVNVTLSGSATGINYQLYRGTTAVGSPLAGTGSVLNFGLQTTAGTYTVLATNASTGCVKDMSGTSTVIVNPLPVVYSVTGGGAFCAGGGGVAVGLSSSEGGVNYQLYNGSTTFGGVISGTGTTISFGVIANAGTYTVLATNSSTGCISNMTGSATITINSLPTVFSVSTGGAFCSGSTGINVSLSGSTSGINYQLYRGTSVVNVLTGTGAALSFGIQTIAGTYTVLATNPATSCTSNMSGSSVIIVNSQPAVFDVTGGGVYCAGGNGVNIGLSGSASGISYQLFNGSTPVGSPQTGIGATINFGLQTAVGTYTVLATNTLTGCTRNMNSSASIATNPLPAVFSVTGGGSFCVGGSGVSIGLNGSVSGVNYQLYRGATLVGSPVAGTGSSFNFPLQSVPGSYSVAATTAATGCAANMTGSASVSVNSLPNLFAVTGGGSYCNGGTGVAINMGSTETGVNYQLYAGSSVSGTPIAGTGSGATFGLRTAAGIYTVLATNATTGCTNNMTGSATIVVNALPTVYNVGGGGGYCNGGTGAVVTLSGSNTGINYDLYNGATLVASSIGTGSIINFAPQTTAASYTVRATNATTGCINSMAGSSTIFVNALPAAFSVTGGGNYCIGSAGVHIGLAGSTGGVSYQLYRGTTQVGTAVAGTGAGLDFGVFTTAGTYSVSAVSTAGCSAPMSGSVSISVNPAPVVFAVSGSGNYCAGGSGLNVTLAGSETGVNYQLFNGTSASGLAMAGTGSSLSFGPVTSGTYTVMASNPLTTCSAAMTGSAVIGVNPLPSAYTVAGGGSFCAGGTGFHITLGGSEVGVNYQLYNGVTASGVARPGTGSSIDFGVINTAGTYTVLATNASTSCAANMTGNAQIIVNALPVARAVTGGGGYCVGGTGVHVGLAGSANGISYQLYNGSTSVGAALAGTGSALDFGVMSVAGVYSVRATNTTTSCTNGMTGTATVSVNPLPEVYPLTTGGSFCAGGPGVVIYVTGSQIGVNYQLYSGSTAIGSPVPGNNSFVGFGLMTVPGTYSVVATNSATSCSANMTGSATISVNPVPVVYAVTGGGSYCSGGAGVPVGLSGSEIGINYQLYNGITPVGTVMPGNGGSISFGLKTAAGTYSVAAVNATTGCTNNMASTVAISINTTPTVYSVTGGGNYCAGSTGVAVGLNGSSVGVNYQLYNGTVASGAAIAGTGGELSFGLRTVSGTYTVMATSATSSCSSSMADNAVIGINPLPTVYAVSGGGSYCNGGAGVTVGLSNSTDGVNYQLFNGSSMSGTAVAGTGGPISFGLKTQSGTYTVLATDASSSCTRNMSSSAVISINPLPVAYNLSGGGSYCAGGTGVSINLDGSNTGISYQLYNGSAAAMSAVGGSGTSIDFGTFTTAGTYSILATNTATNCSRVMTGTAVIAVNPLPTAFTMTGGGNYCNGTTGVAVGLSGSATGITYQLYRGSVPVGGLVSGTGSAINFGSQTAGTYSVQAINSTTSCSAGMTGSVEVIMKSLPAVYNVTGGGSYCAGGTGLDINLNWSDAGVNYRLYKGSVAVGSAMAGVDGPLAFGLQTAEGDYTVVAVNATSGCTSNMTGSAPVIVNALPGVHTVTGGGSYCAGGTGVSVGLNGSEAGVNYTLYNGGGMVSAPVSGSGSVIDFGVQTVAGAYTVSAADATTGCTSNMTGNAVVNINALPPVHTVIASGSSYCAGGSGVSIVLNGSDINTNYQLYYNGTLSGSAFAGTGAPINFGLKTGAGVYSVIATSTTTSCGSSMMGNPVITINPLPSVYPVTGGGAYCEGSGGVHIGLNGSNSGISYRLYTSSGAVGAAIAGTGDVIDMGVQTNAGIYQIVAKDDITSCTRTMSGNAVISINAVPAQFPVTGGGSYCSGGAGVHVGLEGSVTGIRYQLYKGATAVGSPVNGTGANLDFGVYTVAGSYSVAATNTTTSCSSNMTGIVNVSINTLPSVYAMSGGGNYCQGGSGIAVGLSGTDTGVRYQLYKGTAAIGSPVTGTGAAAGFGLQTGVGSYSVVATNMTTGCVRNMSGIATVGINELPAVYAVSGGGGYCAGGSGAEITMTTSASGVNYQLYQGLTAVGTPVAGTGGMISLGLQTEGTYSVMATNATTTCHSSMSGVAVVTVTPTIAPSVSIGSSATSSTICAGTHITFTAMPVNGGSSPSYQWKVNGVNVGFPVNTYSYVPANGDVVSVALTSSATCPLPATVSSSATMTIQANQTPAVSITADPGTSVCKGSVVTFTPAPVYGGAAPTYSWWKNGVSVATGGTYSVVPNDNDIIAVMMTSNYACRTANTATSDNVMMNVNEALAPTVAIVANPGTTITAGQDVQFTAVINNGGPAPQFQWFVNGETIAGATTDTYIASGIADKDSVTCVVVSSGPCGGLPSFNTVIMNVTNSLAATQLHTADMDVRIMPNPNKGTFTVKGSLGTDVDEDVTMEITDMLGQVVYSNKVHAIKGRVDQLVTLDNSLANGMYLLNMKTATNNKVFHISVGQ